ncbi:uncharacterized protein LOC108205934 isoform X1 [Daucus carota subsp. sativus]|uniref:uncharacterized protein LOC108205934 isoform X1 n=1 Tax=Daucus carota subsp. sativus TaxID=79200 RepID=UPI0007EF65AB|nr:PREDICTED: uncharacterized protein LOC108205934 isoform X1 [Daucus carota subsp. sativus]
MSVFIELVETFCLPTLTEESYYDKISGLLDRYPKRGRAFRSVLPENDPKTADDYVSMKFCTIGRVPVYGIYNKSDLQLSAVCVQGTLFAIDDCDLDPNLVPDLQFHRVILDIRHSSLAVSESLSYTKGTMCSAVSTLSLGYMPEKKNEWTSAIVLLSGMTTQAVRFYRMKGHVGQGLTKKARVPNIPHYRDLRLQNRWHDICKAVRREEYPYQYNLCNYDNKFTTDLIELCWIRYTVALINFGDGVKGENFSRKYTKERGQSKGSHEKHVHEQLLRLTNCRWLPKLLNARVLAPECLVGPMIRYKKSHVPAPTDAARLQGRGKVYKFDASGSFLWFKRHNATSPASYGTSAGCVRTLFTATIFSMQRSRCEVDKIKSNPFFRSLDSELGGVTNPVMVSTSGKYLSGFDQFEISKEEKNLKRDKGNQGPWPFVQMNIETISGRLKATYASAMQVTRTRMQAESFHLKIWTKCLLCKK